VPGLIFATGIIAQKGFVINSFRFHHPCPLVLFTCMASLLFRIRNKREKVVSRPRFSWYKLNSTRNCSAQEWEGLLLSAIASRLASGASDRRGFAKPEIYEAPEERVGEIRDSGSGE
jgi:hypothetical protein